MIMIISASIHNGNESSLPVISEEIINNLMNGWMDGWMDEWMDECMDGCSINSLCWILCIT